RRVSTQQGGAGLGDVVEHSLLLRREAFHGFNEIGDEGGTALQAAVHLRPIRFRLRVQGNHFVAAPDVHTTDNQRKDQNDSEDRSQYFHEEPPSQNITSRIIANKKSTTCAT